MAAVEFNVDVNLDGFSYPAARTQLGGRQTNTSYVPKVKAARMSPVGDATLDPLEYVSFHRGSGASRNIGIDNMIAWCENAWTGDPGILLPGPEVTGFALPGGAAINAPVRPDGISEADGHIIVASGRYINRLSNGQVASPTPSVELDLGAAGIGYSVRRFGSSLFLSSNLAGAYSSLGERPDGGSWTGALLGSSAVPANGALGRVWWTTAGLTLERLVAQFGNRGIRYCSSSPRLDTSWTPGLASAAIDTGGTGQIARFATSLTHLYIAATSGLLDLDQSGMAPNLVPEAEMTLLPSGGLASMSADGYIYYSAGYHLYRVDATGTSYAKPAVITPMVALPNETPVAGYGTSLVKYGPWLIYTMFDPINYTSWICFGRDVSQQEYYRMFSQTGQQVTPSQFGTIAWNVAPIVIKGWKVTALHLTGLSSDGPRLYMFGINNVGSVQGWWAPLWYTTPYGDLMSGRARRFAQSCSVTLPAEDGGDDAIQKDIEEVLNESENLGGGNSITVSARKENETGFTQLAQFTSGPRQLEQIGSAFLTSRPTFRIDMVGTPISPPISRRISIRWLPNPDVREVRKYLFQVGRAEQYGSGTWSGYGAEESIANLVRLATSAARAAFTDEAGKHLNVRVLLVEGPTEQQAASSNDRVLVVGVTMSIFGAAPGPPFGYDQGVGWDSGHSWS